MAKAELLVHSERMPQMSQSNGLPVREDVLFTNKNGVDKPGLRKDGEKMLGRLAEPLKQLLQPGEVILYCCKAQSPLSVVEQFFTGWWAQVMTRVVLVATNRRLFQFSVTGNGTWKRSVSALSWGDITKVKTSRFIGGHFIVHCKNGKKIDYWGVKFGAVPKLQAISDKLIPESTSETTPSQAPVSLCPDCCRPLTPRVYVCGNCGLVFKNEKTLVKMAIFVPGGAYFYTGFTAAGVITALGELFLLLEIVVLAIASITERNTPEWASFVVALGIFIAIYAFETLVTIMHNQRVVREFIPTKKKQAQEPMVSSSAAAQKGF